MNSLTKVGLIAIATLTLVPSTARAQTYPGVRFVATLTGGTTGDPDGRGTAYVWADQAHNRICATITVSNIQLPGISTLLVRFWSGPIVYMSAPRSSGCMETDENTGPMIAAMLSGRYPMKVAVHNAQYGQALWGILRRG